MKAVAYVRVSTDEQAQHGVSLDAQEERIRAYCTMAGLQLVGLVREEGVSAGKPLATRPGGERLLAIVAREKAQHVVALKLDRLFRDAVDALTQTRAWDAAGVALHLVDMGGQTLNTGSAMGRMFLTMTAAFAELERNLISERTKTALQYKKAQGVRLGRPVAPVEDPDDIATVRLVQTLKGEGLTLRAIADRLNAEQRPTKRGGRWHASTVRWMLETLAPRIAEAAA